MIPFASVLLAASAAFSWSVDLDVDNVATNVPLGAGKFSLLTIPKSEFANPHGVKTATLLFDGTWWHLECEGHVDEDSVCAPLDHPAAPFPAGTRHFEKNELGDLQGWRPGGHNATLGDVAGIWYKGRLHVFYLADRRHHGSKGGAGGHFFAHVSSADLKTWKEHAPAVPLTEWWQTVGTGTPFVLKDGRLALAYGFHTERMDKELAKGKPVGATYAVSNDGGETFEPTGKFFHSTRNPTVFNRPDGRYGMVTGYHNEGGVYVSDDLENWTLVDNTTGKGGDCPCLFEWNGHHYLIQGYIGDERLLHSTTGKPGSWEDWSKDIPDLYAGLAVPMVVAIPENRRLLLGWRPDRGPKGPLWGGAMEIRELKQAPDGRLRSVMLKRGLTADGLCASAFAASSAVEDKRWMYPQMDMELYRVHAMRDDVRRMGLYASHPGELPPLRNVAEFRRRCAADDPLPEVWGRIDETHYDVTSGVRYVSVTGGFCNGGAIRSAEPGWEGRTFDGTWHPVAEYPDAPVPPHRERLPEDRAFAGLVATNGWYDVGEERLAHVECAADRAPCLFVGESVPEMLCEDKTDMEYDPTMICVADGRWRTERPLAFRYLRFRKPVRDVKVVPVGRKRPVVGSVRTGDARRERMFEVGVRTLALCSDDFLIDGVKRDRLPWGGDLTVSLLADAYVYGDAEIARRSLSVLDAYEGDINKIVNYSMWTIISHDLYQLYFGDRKFLEDRWWRIKWRVEQLVSRTDERGFVVRGLDWVFVDWAKPRSVTALHVIWYGALQAAARLADRVGDTRSAFYRELAEKVRTNVDRLAWDETRGIYRANPNGEPVFGRQANVFAVVLGFADAAKAARIGDALAGDGLPPVGTPYVYGWELVALARTGHHQAFFDGIEKVFGAMLDAGATTFWEGYDASEKGDACYGFYGRPWGKSLCHVWSAWPAFVFVSEAMGVKPTSDGWQTWQRKPITGAERFSAVVPTPKGSLCIGESTH